MCCIEESNQTAFLKKVEAPVLFIGGLGRYALFIRHGSIQVGMLPCFIMPILSNAKGR
ncbi:hypothetical protein DFP94_11024 [Fontibacillus phaseoli]|uniref:Uncharacterized protein n=1 Tax=Fontibacillus phaseoli TaxID=1416533 RepID=A0A369BBC2_9BACL|nr:hypothetical protein DFP94_11024 [Fontibacillus phaseoli]